MKSLLLTANSDAKLGFRLAGIESKIVKDKTELLTALKEAIADDNIALILITSDVGDSCYQEILEIKRAEKESLILLIPEPRAEFKDYIAEYVNQSIGIKT